jgi:hypothetical protein
MNFYDMRLQFDRVMRTLTDATFEDYRDDYLNLAWEKITESFLIPSLKREIQFDSVANQTKYPLPYDYNGTEVYLWYTNTTSSTPLRLDPVEEDTLGLMYERRSSNMGQVRYYDWTNNFGSDYAARTCTLVNGSATVACATAAAGDVNMWIRFDPFTTGSTTYNPGDYGYYISAVTAGVSYTLSLPYRGPAGDTTGRIRPSEQQQFIVYGYPTAAVTNAFKLLYYAKPMRLYNDTDVPEWPSLGLGIVYMALSVGYDFMTFNEQAKIWYGRAMGTISNLERRRNSSKRLITDITIGSVNGRKTGPYSAYNNRQFTR